MSANATYGAPTWTGTESCPFCGATLADPGAGFIAHLDEAPECQDAFDGWRERIREDLSGEWSG